MLQKYNLFIEFHIGVFWFCSSEAYTDIMAKGGVRLARRRRPNEIKLFVVV
jgi:hypothetical protein